MPILFHRPMDRRAFLRTAACGTATIVFARAAGRAAAAREGAETHLALISDTHVPGDRLNGHRGFNPWENLRTLAPKLVQARPHGVILCGDAARLEGLPEDYAELHALLQPVAGVAPVYIGLGNHDDRANFLKAFAPPPGVRAPVDGRHVTVIETDAVRVLLLDSLLYPNRTAGLLGRAQRAWLASFLPKASDRPTVLFVHHTLKDGDGDLLDADKLFALAVPHAHVKAIFYGHSHVWELGERDGLKLINLPAVGYNFRDQDPVGWVEARFRRDGVALTLHAEGGERAEDGKTTGLSWR